MFESRRKTNFAFEHYQYQLTPPAKLHRPLVANRIHVQGLNELHGCSVFSKPIKCQGCVRLSPPGIADSTGFHWIPLKNDEANLKEEFTIFSGA